MKKVIDVLLGGAVILLSYLLFVERSEEKNANKKYAKFKKYYQVYNKWISNTNQNINISDLLAERGVKSISVYGNGEMGNRLIEALEESDLKVQCVIERKANDIGLISEKSIKVVGIDEIKEYKDSDMIIVTPLFDYDNIYAELKKRCPDVNVVSVEDVVFFDTEA